MTTTNQKVNLNNCTHEQLFKAISKIQAKAAATFVKDQRQVGYHMKHMTDMLEHYVVNAMITLPRPRKVIRSSQTFFQASLELPRIIGKKKAYHLDSCLLGHTLAGIMEIRPKSIRL